MPDTVLVPDNEIDWLELVEAVSPRPITQDVTPESLLAAGAIEFPLPVIDMETIAHRDGTLLDEALFGTGVDMNPDNGFLVAPEGSTPNQMAEVIREHERRQGFCIAPGMTVEGAVLLAEQEA